MHDKKVSINKGLPDGGMSASYGEWGQQSRSRRHGTAIMDIAGIGGLYTDEAPGYNTKFTHPTPPQ